MAELTIAGVSELLGVPVPTIRSWERRYGYPSPSRTTGQHRRYTPADVEQLRALRDEIARGRSAREAVAYLTQRPAADERGLGYADSIVAAAQTLSSLDIRKALEDATTALGFEGTVRSVLFPALHRIGTMWEERRIDVASEHLATQVVRLWLARMLALAPPSFHGTRILFACGPDDLHSVGLEVFQVALGRRGWAGQMLGASTPLHSILYGARTTRAQAVIVSAHQSTTRRSATEALKATSKLPGVKAFYGGAAFLPSSSRRNLPGVYLGDDVIDAVEIFERTMRKR